MNKYFSDESDALKDGFYLLIHQHIVYPSINFSSLSIVNVEMGADIVMKWECSLSIYQGLITNTIA